ncbi:MAG: hypothetical protein KatS3mg103_1192 [Phycisphaerales bacterium]|nr:MAG: hypothetical protein KatS3mg103_1192 [Phycisphaerales bacterium]
MQAVNLSSVAGVRVSDSIGMAVAAKTLDAARAQGRSIEAMIRSASAVGAAGRGRVAESAGPGEVGQRLDVQG